MGEDEGEEWRDISGYEGAYQVSNMGRVRSLTRMVPCSVSNSGLRVSRGQILKHGIGKTGYHHVALMRRPEKKTRTVKVYALVAEAFIGPRPEGAVIRHLDHDKSNNCASNLAYGTPGDNMRDTMESGRHYKASRTECHKGHPYNEENTIWHKGDNGNLYRRCRKCRQDYEKARYAQRSGKIALEESE